MKIEFTTKVSIYDTNWSGGTRNSYVALNYDGRVTHLPVPSPWNNMIEGQTIDLPETGMIVCHTIFCGKDCGITIFAHPCHLPKWLEGGRNETQESVQVARTI